MFKRSNRRTLFRAALFTLAMTPLLLGGDCDSSDTDSVVQIIQVVVDAVLRIIAAF